MTLLARVSRMLHDAGIAHALIGAAALAAHGVARSTYDVDLLVADARVLDGQLWGPLREAGAVVDIRRGDADDPLGGVIRIEAPGERPVDLVLGKPAWQAAALGRARPQASGPPVISACDLVMLKLYAGGAQDLWDIRELLALPGAGALTADVNSAIEREAPSLAGSWERARQP